MNPDELRKLAMRVPLNFYDRIVAAADAWQLLIDAVDDWDEDVDPNDPNPMSQRLVLQQARIVELDKRLEAAVEKFNAYHQEVTALVPEEWEPGTTWEHAPESCEICAFLVAALKEKT